MNKNLLNQLPDNIINAPRRTPWLITKSLLIGKQTNWPFIPSLLVRFNGEKTSPLCALARWPIYNKLIKTRAPKGSLLDVCIYSFSHSWGARVAIYCCKRSRMTSLSSLSMPKLINLFECRFSKSLSGPVDGTQIFPALRGWLELSNSLRADGRR